MQVSNATIDDITIYRVFANTDMTEGRGSPVLIGTFLDGPTAKAWAKGRGVFGSPAYVRGERARIIRIGTEIYILGEKVHVTIADAEEVAKVALRQAALDKLTPSERAALGL